MIDVTCDSPRRPLPITRRGFLRVGTLGLVGLTLADVLRLRASGAEGTGTAVIQVFLGGGPSHLDAYDPKPEAPAEYRGEFGAIATSVPGVHLSELLPRQARVMERL